MAGCVTQKPVQKSKPSKTELPPYQSIGFYIHAGDPKKALETFEKAYSVHPDSIKTKNLYSSLLLTVGKIKEAESVILETLAREPENTDALYNRAMLENIKGNTQAETNTLTKILTINPKDTRALSSLGELQLAHKQYKQAEKNFTTSLKINSDDLAAQSGYGNLLLREKKYKKAVSQFDKVIEKNPDYSFAYADRSKAKSGLNDAKGALEDLNKAVELDPEYYWNYIDRGKLLTFLGNSNDAIRDFSKAITINPGYFYAYVYQAGLYKDAGKNSLALRDYEQVFKLRPDYYFIYEPLAVLEYLKQNYVKASEFFQKAMERWPEEPSYFLMTGISLESAGEKKKAENFFRNKIASLPGGSYYYDIARMFIEPGFDKYLIEKLNHEKNAQLKTRILFYIASYYKLQGHIPLAKKYFLEVADAGIYGIFETDLAENEVKEIQAR